MNVTEQQLRQALRNQVLQQENINNVIEQMSNSLGLSGIFIDKLRVLVEDNPEDFYNKVRDLITEFDKCSTGSRTVNKDKRD